MARSRESSFDYGWTKEYPGACSSLLIGKITMSRATGSNAQAGPDLPGVAEIENHQAKEEIFHRDNIGMRDKTHPRPSVRYRSRATASDDRKASIYNVRDPPESGVPTSRQALPPWRIRHTYRTVSPYYQNQTGS